MSNSVAISVRRKDGLDSAVDPRFGRAPAFIIVDPDTYEVVAEFDNAFAAEVLGAGTAVAAEMSRFGVRAVISGSFGPKAYQALNKFGVEMWLSPGDITAAEAFERFVSGTLERMIVRTY